MLTGRASVFSAGFDLKVLQSSGTDAADMLRGGFELSERLLSFPRPVIMQCPGNAIAMGAFLLASGDYSVGVAGPFKIVANEVAIGLTMPRAAVAILRNRLTPAAFNRAVTLADTFTPDEAVAAGFLDREDMESSVRELAVASAALDADAHAASKLRARASALAAIRDGIEADDAEVREIFLKIS